MLAICPGVGGAVILWCSERAVTSDHWLGSWEEKPDGICGQWLVIFISLISHNLCSQVNTGHVSDHHTPSQIWISLHTITYNTKLDARYVIKIKHGKMVLYWEGERFQASFAWKKQICWHGAIQFCKYIILSQKKYTNLLQSEPFYHVEQDIIMVSKLDIIVLVFNENYRADGVLLSSLDLLR